MHVRRYYCQVLKCHVIVGILNTDRQAFQHLWEVKISLLEVIVSLAGENNHSFITFLEKKERYLSATLAKMWHGFPTTTSEDHSFMKQGDQKF